MNRLLLWSMVGIFCGLTAVVQTAEVGRSEELLDVGWEFSHDQQNWRKVEVPHDWAIERPFDRLGEGKTAKLPWKGVGWYRRNLVLDEEPRNQRICFDFGGIMGDSTVYVNQQPVGRQTYGYLGLWVDATPYLQKGTNAILVRADTTKLYSRWYPGAGIYRRVKLVRTPAIYLDSRDLYVTTPAVDSHRATIKVEGKITSRALDDDEIIATFTLKDPQQRTCAVATQTLKISKCAQAEFEISFTLTNPQLWQMQPHAKLYTLAINITAKHLAQTDQLTQRFGIRTFTFDPDRGFFLNGKHTQLKGVNLHSDLGILGAAFNRSAMARQLKKMVAIGVNAIRTSHNPPATELLELCDEMGLFVWNECFDKWDHTCGRGELPLEPFVEEKLREFVRRDRNHPCVFIWSIGNEINPGKAQIPNTKNYKPWEQQGTTAERCTRFRQSILELDTSRPVGIGSCFPVVATRGDYRNLDISGWNYNQQYLATRKAQPKQCLIYSESASAFSNYGYYGDRLPTNKLDYAIGDINISSYDLNAAPWSDIPDLEFERMERDRFVAGEFVWTGIDYLGEPTPYTDPTVTGGVGQIPLHETARSSYFGINDLLALPKDRTYLYRSYWLPQARTLHIVPSHWNFPERQGQTLPVYVYTEANEAELFINGVSQGRRRKDPSATSQDSYYGILPRYRLIWPSVPYQPGEVKVVAYDANGKPYNTTSIRTASHPERVVLTPDAEELSANRHDYLFVEVTLADTHGTPIPRDNRRIYFSVEGPGEIVSVGNGNPRGTDCFKQTSSHPLHNGRAGLFIRRLGKGVVTLMAKSDGVQPATLTFK